MSDLAWTENHAALEEFYSTKGEKIYGIFSPGEDRFVAVDRYDLWSTFHAAKLLSSKMSLFVYVLSDSGRLTNLNCLSWTVVDKDVYTAENQTPVVKRLLRPNEIKEVGPAKRELNDWAFVRFVLSATHALRLTDALLNGPDQVFYARFFPEGLELRAAPDNTQMQSGFVLTMESILYSSNSIAEALGRMAKALPLVRPGASPARQSHAETFYALLGWSPLGV